MKILFCPCHYVFDDGDRGSELSWAFQIVDTIALNNPDSVVVTGFKNVKQEKKYKIIEIQKNKKNIDLGIINAFRFNFLYTRYAKRILKKKNFDIIHHVLPFGIDKTYNFSFILGNSKTKKIVGPIQNPLPFYKDNIYDNKDKKKRSVSQLVNRIILMFLSPILKLLSTMTLKKADKIIVINEKTRKILLSRNIDPKKIVIISPGVDCKKFSYVNNKKSLKTIEFISVGSLIERKGFDVLIKSMFKVVEKRKDVFLRILGDGPQKNNLEDLVRELQLEKYVKFEGHVSHNEMPKYYKNASIFISMSRAESWGQMYLEAMASGLPIISSKNDGSRAIIKNNVFGYLIEQDDAISLSSKILELIYKQNKIIKFGILARKEAEDKYDWKNIIIPQYLDAYEDIL